MVWTPKLRDIAKPAGEIGEDKEDEPQSESKRQRQEKLKTFEDK